LICHDDGTNAARVAALYRRLLDDEHVDLIIGGYGTNTLRPGRSRRSGAPPLSATPSSITVWGDVAPRL
jgi:hypothetical protein